MKTLILDEVRTAPHTTRTATPLAEPQKVTPRFTPKYLEQEVEQGGFLGNFFQLLIRAFLSILLRPRKGEVGALDQAEVDSVYSREASSYDWKHHLTTRGMDTTWRRAAGWAVTTYAREHGRNVEVLDLCTGTGLSIVEILKVMGEWGVGGHVTGLEYNERMLGCARSRRYRNTKVRVGLERGDATSMVHPSGNFIAIPESSVDVVTHVFGIGGIQNPTAVFEEVLKVLVLGGQYIMIDMHRPIPSLPGEIRTPFGWLQAPVFEAMTYAQTTLPVALKRLWGWRDTTPDFYMLPNVTVEDSDGVFWGFRLLRFEVESERWWFGLPVMPTGRILVEKVRISREEYSRRQRLLRE